MRTIPGFEDYAITKDGRVWSKPRTTPHGHKRKGRWLKPIVRNDGYLWAVLYKNTQPHQFRINWLVLKTYVGPRPEGMICRHLNGDSVENQLSNLCWGTQKENIADCIKHGKHRSLHQNGEQNPSAKLKEQDVRTIRYLRDNFKCPLDLLAWSFGVDVSHVGKICRRIKWGHVA